MVATATQSVTVTTEAPILQTDKADVHTDITEQQVENLPISGTEGRNFQSLLRTIPGAGLSAETNSQAGNPQRAINVNVNGQSNQGSNTRIDGTQDAYPWLPANVAYVPPADSIESVNIVTHSFDAEQGMTGGAAVNVQITSSENQCHEFAHASFRECPSRHSRCEPVPRVCPRIPHGPELCCAELLPDRSKTLPQEEPKQSESIRRRIGGPIEKDRLFFFTDYERTTQRQLAGPDTRTLPTAAMIQGDFTNLPGNPVIMIPRLATHTGPTSSRFPVMAC
jgi:hypothetical protein